MFSVTHSFPFPKKRQQMSCCDQTITFNETNNLISSTPPQKTPPRRREEDVCLKCNQTGHWSYDCPQKKAVKHTHTSSPGSSSPSASMNLPVVRCPCGQGVCPIFESKKQNSFGRKFYTCPAFNSPGKCKFFLWCDEVRKYKAPMCPCGAGICSINVVQSGEYKGREYFACRIKKNQGACDFFQWVIMGTRDSNSSGDEHKDSPLSNSETSLRAPNIQNTDLTIRKDLSLELELESLVESFDNEKENYQTPDRSLFENENGNPLVEKALCVMSPSNIRCLQRESLLQISAVAFVDLRASLLLKGAQTCASLLKIDFSDEIPSLLFYGWLGRLAFPPLQCLRDCPTVPFCCIFPSFDPVSMPDVPSISCIEGPALEANATTGGETETPTTQTYDHIDPAASEYFQESSNGIEGVSPDDRALSKSVLKLYGDNLLNFLESMEPCDHEEMLKIAEATFGMLHKRTIDFEDFRENVMHYINYASTVSTIEGSMRKDLSSEELINKYSVEKVYFDNVSNNHAMAIDSYNASESRLQSLTTEVSQVKIMLAKLEEQLSRCDAETAELAAHVADLSHDKSIAERKLEAAYQEMEVALDLEQQRESTMDAAKAALVKARSCL